jgi:hypothetical protein
MVASKLIPDIALEILRLNQCISVFGQRQNLPDAGIEAGIKPHA